MHRQFTRSTIELVAEAKIQEAMQDGKFDNLPGFGKPFEFDDTEYNPNWWIIRKMKLERLRMHNGQLSSPES